MLGRMAEWSKALRSTDVILCSILGASQKLSSFDEYFYLQGVALTPHLTPKCQNGKISF